jgi:hypothetical protein
MPFVQPTLSASSGDRVGATALNGSLAPVIRPGFMTSIGADIAAFPPLGVIGTKVAAGFNIGTPPRTASMLLVTVAGTAALSLGLVETFGAWAHAHAELSITIEEWRPSLTPSGGPRVPPELVSSTVFNPTKIFDIWGAVVSFQFPDDTGAPFSSVAAMPIGEVAALEHHSFTVWINLVQSAECEAASGYAAAVSNVAFDFPPPFFVLT